jgi:hypothetical protein
VEDGFGYERIQSLEEEIAATGQPDPPKRAINVREE